MPNNSFVESYLRDVGSIAETISREDIKKVILMLYDAWREDRQIFVAGNGGSASTASHFASDLNKFTSVQGKRRFRAFALTDNMPLMTALVNDEGWENVYSWQLENFMRNGDVLVAISVHGGSGSDQAGPWSQNLLKAVKLVQRKEGRVVAIVGFDGGLLRKVSDSSIVVPIKSTPQVEGFHLVLTHLIVARLRELLGKSGK
jgi:D-sedoheptulose 7-phosphate isomerase